MHFCFQPKAEAEEAFCVHWKLIAGKGVWARDGCFTLHINSTHTACSCSHLSTFALLMAPVPVEVSFLPPQIKGWALSLVFAQSCFR